MSLGRPSSTSSAPCGTWRSAESPYHVEEGDSQPSGGEGLPTDGRRCHPRDQEGHSGDGAEGRNLGDAPESQATKIAKRPLPNTRG